MSLKAICSTFFVLTLFPFTSWAAPIEEKQILLQEAPTFCYITPPKGWEIADPKNLAKSVQIAFIKKGNHGFNPSINLAVERSDLSLTEYLKVVRKIHESDKNNRWRQLGKVHTQAGVGQLTTIDTTTDWGSIRILQLILPKQGFIYVVTAAAPREHIAQYYNEFQSTFRSLQITDDLVSTVPQIQRRDNLKERTEQLLCAWEQAIAEGSRTFLDPKFQSDHWLPFQEALVGDYEDMGPHWQVLFLKDISAKLLGIQIPQSEELSKLKPQEALVKEAQDQGSEPAKLDEPVAANPIQSPESEPAKLDEPVAANPIQSPEIATQTETETVIDSKISLDAENNQVGLASPEPKESSACICQTTEPEIQMPSSEKIEEQLPHTNNL